MILCKLGSIHVLLGRLLNSDNMMGSELAMNKNDDNTIVRGLCHSLSKAIVNVHHRFNRSRLNQKEFLYPHSHPSGRFGVAKAHPSQNEVSIIQSFYYVRLIIRKLRYLRCISPYFNCNRLL